MSDNGRTFVVSATEQFWKPSSRRSFLKLLGVGGTLVLAPTLFEACDSYTPVTAPGTGGSGGAAALDLSTDIGILNYAYALEQLEAAFYTAVVGSAAFGSLNAEQQEVMNDLRNHEVIHREFFKAALGAGKYTNVAVSMTFPAGYTRGSSANGIGVNYRMQDGTKFTGSSNVTANIVFAKDGC